MGEAREYLNVYGGVHVYDKGFHLPYYGVPTNDWLKIEFDHSHRRTISELLPEKYKITRGLQFLPSLGRIIGVVKVDTTNEKELQIVITRDRLQDSRAYTNLIDVVRWGLDFYAYNEKIRELKLDEEKGEVQKPKIQKVEDVLSEIKEYVDPKKYDLVIENIKEVINQSETEAEKEAAKVSLIGPLATVGISALAIHHETKWQINNLDLILNQIKEIEPYITNYELKNKFTDLKNNIIQWIARVKLNQELYGYFNDVSNIENIKRYSARTVIEDVTKQVQILARNIPINTSKVDYVLLPKASLVEWSSIFQNVIINAFNAMIDSNKKEIQISTIINKNEKEILIQDTGSGVDLSTSEELFKPFVRKLKLSPEREALGYGGTGLGLTIIRLIANRIGCQVSFVVPEPGFKTAFSIKWRDV